MNLLSALRLNQAGSPSTSKIEPSSGNRSIAFVGSGGKTTAMFQLARLLAQGGESGARIETRVRGRGVIVTATTHLSSSQIPLADRHIIANEVDDVQKVDFKGVTLVTGPIQGDGRTLGAGREIVSCLHAKAQELQMPLLIEADGSRQKPLKAPGESEPPIPDFVDTVILLAGLRGLGKKLDEEVIHRPQIFAALSGSASGEVVGLEAIARVLTHPLGGLKNIPPSARRVVILNQAETPELQSAGHKLVESLLASFDAVLIANLKEEQIFAVCEPVAGIILAAGEAKRFGQSKQLLDWRGEPFVRAVAKTALDARLAPVVVVVGANGEKVESAIRDLPLEIVSNEKWRAGQSSSIRAGLETMPGNMGAAIFLLADQPQMTPAVIRSLMAHHATGLYPIVAPLVMMEQRANPVLFDRSTFPDLLTLEGDVGGRALFSKYQIEYLPWHDDSLLLDVDKPDDYPRMKELE